MKVLRTRGPGAPERGQATGGPRARPVAAARRRHVSPTGRPPSGGNGGNHGKSGRRGRRRSPSPKRFRLLRGLAYWGAVAAVWGLLILGGLVAYVGATVPDPTMADLERRPPNIAILAADGAVLAERGVRRDIVRLNHLPRHLIEAVLATEDRRFYGHWGVDPFGLARAAVENARAGDIVEGGSTITQQLAKNLFLTPERTYWRKAQELVLALWLEVRFSKDQILELYLNRVYFGGGAYGVEAAARRFFDKPAARVTLPEAAMLAGLLKAPSRYAPSASMDRADGRASQVLASMVAAGYLTPAAAMAAIAAPAHVGNPSGITGHEYAVDWIADLLPGFVGEIDTDILVETTIDARLQRALQTGVEAVMAGAGETAGGAQAAVVVLDPDGAVRALAGGRSYARSQYNRAVRAQRQPGSAFKPFVYLAALEAGMTPDTLAHDAPITVAGWSPRNYSGRYQGPVTLREALAQSINTVSVRLALEVGRKSVAGAARRLGIVSPLHDNLSIALGTAEVSLLELTGAYAPFANGGRAVMPHAVARVRTRGGKVLYARKGSGLGQVVAADHVGAMNEMLNATLIEGTGNRAALPDRPAAGKTGTTQNFRDAWFVGYTADYVAGVWVGNDDGAPMARVTGGTLPAEIWRHVMAEAHDGLAVAALPGTYMPAVAEREQPAFVPASHGGARDDWPFFRRMLGIFSPSG